MDKRPFVEKLWSVHYPMMLLVALQFFDVLSSLLAGQATLQGNPFMASLIGSRGMSGVVVAKCLVIATVFFAVWADSMQGRHVPVAITALNIMYGVILGAKFEAYGQWSGDWFLPVAFWAAMLGVATAAVDEAFFSRRAHAVGTGLHPEPAEPAL